jgi:hypothetical protein
MCGLHDAEYDDHGGYGCQMAQQAGRHFPSPESGLEELYSEAPGSANSMEILCEIDCLA